MRNFFGNKVFCETFRFFNLCFFAMQEQAKCIMYQNELKSSGVTSKTLVEVRKNKKKIIIVINLLFLKMHHPSA